MAEMPGSHRDQWGSQFDVVLLDKDNGGAYTWVTSNPIRIRAVLHDELSVCQLDQSPSLEHIGSIDEAQINFTKHLFLEAKELQPNRRVYLKPIIDGGS